MRKLCWRMRNQHERFQITMLDSSKVWGSKCAFSCKFRHSINSSMKNLLDFAFLGVNFATQSIESKNFPLDWRLFSQDYTTNLISVATNVSLNAKMIFAVIISLVRIETAASAGGATPKWTWVIWNKESRMASSLQRAIQATTNCIRRLKNDPDEKVRQAYQWHLEYRMAEAKHYGLPSQHLNQMNWIEFGSWWENTAVEIRDSACRSWARGFDADVKLFQDRERRSIRRQRNAA